jgi:hypothetical protein
MFLSIHYPRLRNDEFIQFIKLLVEIVNSNDPEVLKVKAQCDDLAALLAVISALYKPNLGSAITQELQEIDTRRDAAIVAIEMQIKSFIYHYEPAKQEAAQLLTDSLATYGPGISRMNYQAESTTIDSLVAKWENEPVLIAALTTLNLNEWVAELKMANTLFGERYLARIRDDADNPEQKTIELRKQIIQSYRILISHLQAHATLSIDETYTEVIKQANLLIEQYNQLVDSRSNNKEEEEVLIQE